MHEYDDVCIDAMHEQTTKQCHEKAESKSLIKMTERNARKSSQWYLNPIWYAYAYHILSNATN